MKVASWWERFENQLLTAGVIISALNLFVKSGIEAATIDGWLVDYLLIKIYAGEIILAIGVIAVIVREKWKLGQWVKKNFLLLAAGVCIWAIALSKAVAPMVMITKTAEIVLLGVAAVIVREKWGASPDWRKKWQKLVAGLITGESALAIYQFWQQKSLFPYPILGETVIEGATTDVMRASFLGKTMILPYGTFSHPNILAGSLAIWLWWSWRETGWREPNEKMMAFLGLLVILLTRSIGAIIFVILLTIGEMQRRRKERNGKKSVRAEKEEKSGTIKKETAQKAWLKRKISGISLIIIGILVPLMMMGAAIRWSENMSVVRRAHLNQVALKMWEKSPFFGVGIGQFTVHISDFWSDNKFTQPVHNVFLLIVAEIGIVGVGWLIWFSWSQRKIWQKWWQQGQLNNFWVALAWIILFSWDHYLLTSFWGMLLWLVFL